MRGILFALTVVLAAGPAAASVKTDAMASVRQFVDAFNMGDTKTALAACASQASIIDDFPPHVWQGSKACSDWSNAFNADSKKQGITDAIVVPATYTYKQHGKRLTESGSVFTVALQEVRVANVSQKIGAISAPALPRSDLKLRSSSTSQEDVVERLSALPASCASGRE